MSLQKKSKGRGLQPREPGHCHDTQKYFHRWPRDKAMRQLCGLSGQILILITIPHFASGIFSTPIIAIGENTDMDYLPSEW